MIDLSGNFDSTICAGLEVLSFVAKRPNETLKVPVTWYLAFRLNFFLQNLQQSIHQKLKKIKGLRDLIFGLSVEKTTFEQNKRNLNPSNKSVTELNDKIVK